MKRTIKQIINSQKVNMGAIILDQPLPSRGIDMIDPILLIHHWDDKIPGGKKESESGVGPHPHRGFSPVTFIFKGGVHHRDSKGYSGVIYEGGTQWMNSGKGIVHSERPYKELAENGGDFELIQFWVNTPAAFKLDEYSYQPLTSEDTPVAISKDGLVKTGVVAGELKNIKGPVITKSPMLMLRIEGASKGMETISVPVKMNCIMYVLDGVVHLNDNKIHGRQMAILNNDGDELEMTFDEDTRLIILSGEPINEPVVSYGPFVMNTEKEIMQAIQDYQSGLLGVLNETFDS